MNILVVCPGCHKRLSIPSLTANARIRCPACQIVFRSDEAGQAQPATEAQLAITTSPPVSGLAPTAASIKEDSVPFHQKDSTKDSLQPTNTLRSIGILFRVISDPTDHWCGELPAELTDAGLVLYPASDLHENSDPVVVPFGAAVKQVSHHLLELPLSDRKVRVVLINPGVDQVRMARDLAYFLQMRKQFFHEADYRLARGLALLPVVPLGVPFLACVIFLLRDYSLSQTLWLGFWCILSLLACAVFWQWSRSGTPSVVVRMMGVILLTLTGYLVPIGLLTWDLRDSIDLGALIPPLVIAPEQWAEFVDPDKKFRVELPGQPQMQKQQVPGQQQELTVHGVDLKQVAFGITQGELANDFIPVEARFDGARNGMLNTAPGSKLISEKPLLHEGHPAREVVIEKPDKIRLVALIIKTDERFYILLAAGRGYHAQTPDVQRFFTSFRLLSNPIASPTSFEGLLGYWSFDEDEGNVAKDGSGGGNHATIHNAQRVPGKRGKGVTLTRGNHIDLGNSSRFNFPPGAPFTVAGWFKTGIGEISSILHLRDSLDRSLISLNLTNSVLDVSMCSKRKNQSDRITATTGKSVGDWRWHHFALIRQPTGAVWLYLDGVLAAKTTEVVPGLIKTNVRKLGNEFNGQLDEICFFNRPLTEHEIQALAGKIADFRDRPAAPLVFVEPIDPKDDPDPVLSVSSDQKHDFASLFFLADDHRLIGGIGTNENKFLDDGMQIFDTDKLKSTHNVPGRGPILTADQGRKVLHSNAEGNGVLVYDVQNRISLPIKFDGKQVNSFTEFFSLSADETFLLTSERPEFGRRDSTIRKYDFRSGKLLTRWGWLDLVRGPVVSPNNECFAIATQDGLHVCSAETGKSLFKSPIGSQFVEVTHMCFSPDAKYLAVCLGSDVLPLMLLDMETGELTGLLRAKGIGRVAFTPNSNYLFASGGKHIFVVDLSTHETKHEWQLPGGIASLAISPKGQRLAVNMGRNGNALPAILGPSNIILYDIPTLLQLTPEEAEQLRHRPKVVPLPERYRIK